MFLILVDPSRKDVQISNMTYVIIRLHGKLLSTKIKLAFLQIQMKHLYLSDIKLHHTAQSDNRIDF